MSATDFTPLKELQAAHKRLSELRAASSGGLWRYRDDTLAPCGALENANVCVGLFNVAACGPGEALASEDAAVRERTSQANADLIVTLHRTIDAQLALLEDALEKASMTMYNDGHHMIDKIGLQLARAINGSDHA